MVLHEEEWQSEGESEGGAGHVGGQQGSGEGCDMSDRLV